MKLSKSEEILMSHIWKLGKAYMKDLIDEYPDPKPANTTIATLLKRMRDKNFIDFEQDGGSRVYYPIVEKSDYVGGHLQSVVKKFFGNSTSQFASFFTQKSDLSKEELKALREIIDEEIKKK